MTPRHFIRLAKSPCQHCSNRAVGCHATCEQYAAYKESVEEERAKMKAKYVPESIVAGYELQEKFKYIRSRR